MKSEEYATRILLEFTNDINNVNNDSIDAFTISADEEEYATGPIKKVNYKINNIIKPNPATRSYEFYEEDINCNNTIYSNGFIVLQPKEVTND